MDYILGITLEDLALRADKLSQQFVIFILAKLLRSLEQFHEQGFIHCDLKPSNIMLTPNGEL